MRTWLDEATAAARGEGSSKMAGLGASRKDYETIASALRSSGGCTREVAEKLATKLAADNPRFRRDIFMKAAGFEGLGYETRRRRGLEGIMDKPIELLKRGAKWYLIIGGAYAGAWLVDRAIRTARGLQGSFWPGELTDFATHTASDLFLWPYHAFNVLSNVASGGVNHLPIIGAVRQPGLPAGARSTATAGLQAVRMVRAGTAQRAQSASRRPSR